MTVSIEKLVHGGSGLGRVDGRVWLVPFTAPGDVVEARPIREKPGLVEGELVRVVEPGAGRVKPRCAVFGRCGGCQVQHLAYDRQVAVKSEVLVETLQRLGKIEPPAPEVVTGEPWGYRARVELHGERGHVGFFARASHDVVEVDGCPIARPEVSRLLRVVRETAMDVRVAHNCDLELVWDGGHGVVAVIRADEGADRLADRLARLPAFSGVVSGRLTGPARWRVLRSTHISWKTRGVAGSKARIVADARGFSQANAALNAGLAGAVADLARCAAGQRVLELYAGAGNLTVPLLASGADVTAVEVNPAASADARTNAKANKLPEPTIVAAPSAQAVEDFAAAGVRFDVVVADPPRTGLEPGLDLARLSPARIVLVSCEPAALARDVKKLVAAGYRLDRLVLVDMFPQTAHIESVALLRL